MYKFVLRKTLVFVLSLTLVLAVVPVPISVPANAEDAVPSVMAEWNKTYQEMDGLGAALAFTDSQGLLQLAEAGHQDIVQHLLDLAFDDKKGIGLDIVRVIIGDNASIAPTGTRESPGFNPVTGLLADVNKPGYDIEGNPIPTWGGTRGQYGYKPGYNRYFDGNTDSIWPNEPEHDPDSLVPLKGFIWEYDTWEKEIPNDKGGPTNNVPENGDPVEIKKGPRTRKELFDIDQVWTMRQAMKYGVKTFYACMWTAPYWMCNNYTPGKIIRDDVVYIDGTPVKKYYQAYADYLVYYIKGMWEQFGIPITHICPFNEVDLAGGSASYVQEIINDYVGPTLEKALEPGGALHKIKNPEGKEIDFVPQLAAPDGTNLSASLSRGGLVFSNNGVKNQYLDIFTTHLYGTVEIGTDETKLYHSGDFATRPLDYRTDSPKYPEYLTRYRLWQTEFMNQDTSDSSSGAYTQRYGNQNINDAVRYANLITNMFCSNPGFNAYIWWSIWDNNNADGSDLIRFVNNGAQQNPGRTSTLTGYYRIFKRFYGFGHFSRFIEPGDVRFEVTRQPVEDINIVGFRKPSGGDFSITITNAKNDDSIQKLEFTLKDFPDNVTSVTVFRTTASENMKKTGTIPVVDGKFTIDIPSASIVTIVPSDGTYATYEGLDGERDIFSSLEAEGNDNGVMGNAAGIAGRENEAVILSDGDYLAYRNVNFADGSANGGFVRYHLLYLDAVARSEGYGGRLLAYALPVGTEVNSVEDIKANGVRVAEILIPPKAPYGKYQTMVNTGDMHANGHKDLYIVAETGGKEDKIIVDRFLFGANDSDWSQAGNNSTVSIPKNIIVNGDFETATAASTANWSAGRYNNGTFELSTTAVLAPSELQRYTGFSRYLKNSRTSANAASARLSGRTDAQNQYDGIWQDVTGKMVPGERYRFEGYFLSLQDGPLGYEVPADNPGDVKVALVYYDADGNQIGITEIGGRDMPEPLPAREAGDPCYWVNNEMKGEILEGGPLGLSSFQPVKVKVAKWRESDSDPFIYSEPEGTARVVLAVYAEDNSIFYCDLLSIVPEPDRDSLNIALKNYNGNNVNMMNVVKEALTDADLTQAKAEELIAALENDFYEEMSTALVSIKIDGTELEGFNPEIFDYIVTYSAGGSLPEIEAEPFYSDAVVDIDGPDSVPGKAVITVEYGEKQSIYTIEFVADTALSSIKVNNYELKSFNPGVYEYTVRVQEGVTGVPVVSAEAVSSAADVDIEQADSVPGQAIITVSSGNAQSVYKVNFIRNIYVRDDFDSNTNGEPWFWINEDPETWSLTDRPGYLKITTRKGDIYGNSRDLRNILLQDSPGDWVIETKYEASSTPSVTYQQGALMVYQDMDNYMKLDWEAQANGTIIQVLREVNGNVSANSINGSVVGPSNTIWLRISKNGNVYRAYYSVDGVTFTQIGTDYTLNFTDVKTGLSASNGGGTDTTDFHIYFDYYTRSNAHVGELLPTDKTELIRHIDLVKNLTADGYTPGSWAAFQAAYQKAVSLRDDENATQPEVNKASDDLLNAARNLAFVPRDFENGTVQGFVPRGNATIAVSDEANHTSGGKYSLKVTGRTAAWHGALLDVTKFIIDGETYRATAWVKLISTGTDSDTTTVKLTTEIARGSSTNWPNLQERQISTADGWIKLEGTYTFTDITKAAIYVESTSNTASYYIDDIVFENINRMDTKAPEWPDGSALTVTDAVYGELTLNWTPAVDDTSVSEYMILKGLESQVTVTDGVYSGLDVLATVPGNVTQYHVSGLTPGKYIFKVEAGDEAGNWSNNGPVAAVTVEKGEKPWFVKFNEVYVETEVGIPPVLPTVVEAVYSDGSVIELEVTWDPIDESDYAKAGTFTVEGTVEGISRKAVAIVTVMEVVKDLEAPVWPDGSTLTAEITENGVKLSWNAAVDNVEVTAYKIFKDSVLVKTTPGDVLSAEIGNLEPGTYVFSVEAEDEAGNVSTGGPSVTVTIKDSSRKPFTITPLGGLDKNGGIRAKIAVSPDPEAEGHPGTEAIVFQLMNGETPVSIIAVEKDITYREEISAFFNVDPTAGNYRVEVFVFDRFTSSTSDSPVILAEKITID